MNNFLSQEEELKLRHQHKKEKNRKNADRLKAVLLSNKGWTYRAIAEALFIDEETVSTHISDYKTNHKLTNNSGGSVSKLVLSGINETELIGYLHETTYTTVESIIDYVKITYGIKYTKSGMTDWLHRNGFSYKKPQGKPAKADCEQQDEFIKFYEKLKNSLGDEDIILFGDAVHPTMATKISEGWIKTGYDKPIKTTASRTRMNIFGVIDLNTMSIITRDYKTINSDSICSFLADMKSEFSHKTNIHLMLDQGPYNKSAQTKDKAEELGIKIHLLPTYSPNLNPIERLWKVANKHVRNNVFFKSAKVFKYKMRQFFNETWEKIKLKKRKTINDKFQILSPTL